MCGCKGRENDVWFQQENKFAARNINNREKII